LYNLSPVVSAAEDKLTLINQLEYETNELLFSPVDKINQCLKRRQTILDSLIEAESHLKALCEGRDKLTEVINLKCDIGGLAPELSSLFELSLSARAGINRILKMEPQISARLAEEKSSILKKIEGLNTGATATANKYYHSVHKTAKKSFAANNNKTV